MNVATFSHAVAQWSRVVLALSRQKLQQLAEDDDDNTVIYKLCIEKNMDEVDWPENNPKEIKIHNIWWDIKKDYSDAKQSFSHEV